MTTGAQGPICEFIRFSDALGGRSSDRHFQKVMLGIMSHFCYLCTNILYINQVLYVFLATLCKLLEEFIFKQTNYTGRILNSNLIPLALYIGTHWHHILVHMVS